MSRGLPLIGLLAPALLTLVAACGAPPEDAPAPEPAALREPASPPADAAPPAETFADLAAIDAHLRTSPHSVAGHRARFLHHLERGDYSEAHRALNIGLYVLAQADALPPEATWLAALDDHYPPTTRAAEGARLLAMIDDYYSRSPTIDGLLVDYLVAAGKTDQLREYLELLAAEKYPDDPRWSARLRELRDAAPAGDRATDPR
ncbi:MAG: hypothetical protein KC486_19265 [Myxococcales bacterium]|nr:hypothetical protein [Myxococcales bacterium]